MKFLITIDVEEDSWKGVSASSYSTENIKELPRLQALFEQYGAKPSYLLTYQVASSPECQDIFRKIISNNPVEIGAHCHPWSTPPFPKIFSERDTMLCYLPLVVQEESIAATSAAISSGVGIKPVSFRSGRWGFSERMLPILEGQGYKIDTSITPFVDWSRSEGRDYRAETSRKPKYLEEEGCRLFEVPVSIGFLQTDENRAAGLYNFCKNQVPNFLRGRGIASRLGLASLVWLSPEVESTQNMIALMERLVQRGEEVANLTFHSSTLKPGLTPFVKSEAELENFYLRLEAMLKYSRAQGFEFTTLSELLE